MTDKVNDRRTFSAWIELKVKAHLAEEQQQQQQLKKKNSKFPSGVQTVMVNCTRTGLEKVGDTGRKDGRKREVNMREPSSQETVTCIYKERTLIG